MHCAHSLISVATCRGMSNLGFSSSSGTVYRYDGLPIKLSLLFDISLFSFSNGRTHRSTPTVSGCQLFLSFDILLFLYSYGQTYVSARI